MSYARVVKLARLLSRVDAGFGWRGSGFDPLVEAMDARQVSLKLVRVPQAAVAKGLAGPVWENARESLQHQQLKNIAMAWFGPTAAEEYRAGYRFDVFDTATNTVIECGHSAPEKIWKLGLEYDVRMIALPFRHKPLTPEMPLTAVEFLFDEELILAHERWAWDAKVRASKALDW